MTSTLRYSYQPQKYQPLRKPDIKCGKCGIDLIFSTITNRYGQQKDMTFRYDTGEIHNYNCQSSRKEILHCNNCGIELSFYIHTRGGDNGLIPVDKKTMQVHRYNCRRNYSSKLINK